MTESEIAKVCKALGDENRVKIIKMLTVGEMCACKLLEAFNITQPTLSHHMKILAETGLVTVRKDGKWAYYAVNCQRFSAFKAVVAEICCADGAKAWVAHARVAVKVGESDMADNGDISFFNRFLSLWVILCMAVGVAVGRFVPGIPFMAERLTVAGISLPIALLIWVMIFPMMLKVDFASIRSVGRNPKGLFLTWTVNWLVKPFSMYVLASFFLRVVFARFIPQGLATQYLAGAVLLGAAPCTAMVFVWSSLTKGNPAYTVVQVATNDLIILLAFAPIVKFLLGVSDVSVPYSTLFVSVVLFVVIPLAAGVAVRLFVVRAKGGEYFDSFTHKFDGLTMVGLLLTLVLIFSSQSAVILSNPLHIILIAVPLVAQTFLIFAVAYGAGKFLALPHDIAAPAGMIGASNFFELSVAVAVALFGTKSPAALATTVGVLTEVPVMLMLVRIANKTRW